MLVAKVIPKLHQNNKRRHDRRVKVRGFKENDFVYLYNPEIKPRLTRKLYTPFAGPFKITKKISDLNYKIVDKNNKH